MDDERVWALEESLWTGGPDNFRNLLDEASLTLVPTAPFLLDSEQTIASIEKAPRWKEVVMAHRKVVRPQEGLIVLGYRAVARRDEAEDYNAWCTSTWRRVAHDEWRLVQHQQMQAADTPLRGG